MKRGSAGPHPKVGGRAMKPNIGIADEPRQAVIGILDTLLADEYLLYTKTRNYHWNVVGPQFNDLHKFFEAQYEQINDAVDDVAERARSVGGRSVATLVEFVKSSRLAEHPGKFPDAESMLANLLVDHETVIRNL